MAIYAHGDIIYADVPDPLGRPCATPHYAVIITSTEEIPRIDPIWVAVISSVFPNPLPDGWMKMKWAPGGHRQTGLHKDCVLKCNWRTKVRKAEIIRRAGYLDTGTLERAVEWIIADVKRIKGA